LIFTTKRYAEPRLRAFAKSLADKRRGIYVARGKKTIADLVGFAARLGEGKVTVVRKPAEGTDSDHVVIVILPGGGWRWD